MPVLECEEAGSDSSVNIPMNLMKKLLADSRVCVGSLDKPAVVLQQKEKRKK
jgi:hypothetical protein